MAEADRIAAALQYIDEQKPADPFASLKSDPIGALRSAWERKVDPIINNAKRTFATGGVLGDILRAYGEAGAPANRAVLKGMGMPYKEPAVANTPPTLAPDNSYGNMGDTTAQTFGTIIGDPLNFVQPGAARIANALKFAKPDALKMLNEMSQGARSPMDLWHGSPHRFPPTAKNPLGEFDPMKIGTGEGAQASANVALNVMGGGMSASRAVPAGSLGMNAIKKGSQEIMPTEHKSAMSIEPPHNVRDTEKLSSLTKSMKDNGWQGRPILTYDVGRGNEALTGSHRIKAANQAGIEVPIYKIQNAGDYIDKNGKSIQDIGYMELKEQIKWLEKFGDKDAAKLLKQEPEF